MRTSQIRDRLLEQRTLYLNSLEKSKEAITEISRIIDSVTDEQKIMLKNIGIDYNVIAAFDLERMQKDSEYLNECENNLNHVITDLHRYLEDALNV